ncbi:MAG: hypothetical protein ACRD38_01970 [Nitrososphaerales archaeon]
MGNIPSAKALLEFALKIEPEANLNVLHEKTFELMMEFKTKYYERKVNNFLDKLDINDEIKKILREKMLQPVKANGVRYSNFMEEASRRVSQTFQVVSGNLAELCVERELIQLGLIENKHYAKRKERSDITVYHPNVDSARLKHRVEVKNVKLRERATRGLSFDGDSLIGFFDSPEEFGRSHVEMIDSLCSKTGGFCYIPPSTLQKLTYAGTRLRPNTLFASDMLNFVKTGKFV